MGDEGVFDDAGDVCEAEVAGEEVLDGNLVGGAEDGRESAGPAAGLEGQGEAGVPLYIRRSEAEGADTFQIEAGHGGGGYPLRIGKGALYG